MPVYLLLQLIEELTGLPPIDDQSIAEESTWILNQLLNDSLASSFREDVVRAITKEDIGNVLTMLHVHRLDVSAPYCSC
jgi:transcription elongation factor SPT6